MQIQTSDPQAIYTLKAQDAIYKKLYTLRGNKTEITIWRKGEVGKLSFRPISKRITLYTLLQFGNELEEAGFTVMSYLLGPKVTSGIYEGVDIEFSGADLKELKDEQPTEKETEEIEEITK